MKPKSQRFSLIELMIVISLLMLLTSLISPSLNRLITSSNQVSCINNLKHTVSNTLLYTDDYAGYFMITTLRIKVVGTVSWDDHLSDYDGRNLSFQQKKGRAGLETLLYRCPEDQREGEVVNTARSYGINSLLGVQTYIYPDETKAPKNIASISQPDKTIMYSEHPNSSSFGGKFYRKENTFRVNDNRIGNFNSQAGGGRRSLHLYNYPNGIHGTPLYSNYGLIDGGVRSMTLLEMGNGTGKNLMVDNNETGTYFDVNK